MSKMRYCTDLSAQTAEARRQLGLPAESPIWPLKGNMLDRTKYRVPRLHWPYGYVSGDDGSLFVIHREDGKLPSLNMLHYGREKLWYVVARKDGHLVENEVKRGKCEQKVRHASRWIPRLKLKAMGASFAQRPREVVVVWGDSYHQGGTVGPTVAEAVNYGGPGWSIEGYSECSPNCDGYPIPNAFLEFRAPNEPQREQGDEVSQTVHASVQPQGSERLPRNRVPAPTRDGKATESELRMNKQEARSQKEAQRRADPAALPQKDHDSDHAQFSAKEAGQIAYSKGTIIAFLTGTLAPPDTCEPSARFKGMRVSGKFRIAIVAEKNIYDGKKSLSTTANSIGEGKNVDVLYAG
ncbi:hypothetical protein LTR06_011452 [Exophiala xenobiotica]|nr:hypothetical protein LTR06_011452 [Exophiala xenobiotica]